MKKLIEIGRYPVANVLDVLLADKSTKKNIIWATDTYEEFGESFTDKAQMDTAALLSRPDIIRPRIEKTLEAQEARTRKKAEVFTPAWLCNRMNNQLDEEWFGRAGVFNTENEDHTWSVAEEKIEFPNSKKWQRYVDSKRLEITCGEAPYLVSRYDVSTGELIIPPARRIGILDRKLRIVNENTDTYEEWLKWTIRAFQATYGYEYQGDNVLIARINLLLTFTDYCGERWGQPDDKPLRQIANIIARNIWQMDGLKDTVPLGKPYEEYKQLTLFDMFGEKVESDDAPEAVPCRICDWRSKTSFRFMDIKEMRAMGKKLFDYVIGNPPYQEEQEGDNKNYAPPVYHIFLDEGYSLAEKAMFIHPGRCLFDAGSTPKAWNKKILNDPHFKVLCYEPNCEKIFPNQDIKGGVAISYRDSTRSYGSIKQFFAFEELKNILHKVNPSATDNLSLLIYASESYHFTEAMHIDHPEIRYKEGKDKKNEGILSKGHDYDLKSNVLKTLHEIVFWDKIPDNTAEYVAILGLVDNTRTMMYIKRNYIKGAPNFTKYKVFVPHSNGSGALGEVLSTPLIGQPLIGHTQSFLSIGAFDEEIEAKACLEYIKTKFARVMLGILKVTQSNPRPTWRYVPLQDFTSSSDIDWSGSVADIDKQLYAKYGLDEHEIEFIETHVKEME